MSVDASRVWWLTTFEELLWKTENATCDILQRWDNIAIPTQIHEKLHAPLYIQVDRAITAMGLGNNIPELELYAASVWNCAHC